MGSKKKKAEKKKDFVKTKLRVGKTPQNAANATNTAFKAKSIHLRQQITSSLTNEQEIRKQFALLKHHSSTARQEVVQHITHEVEKLPVSSGFPYDELLTKIKPLILDQYKVVREAAIDLLKLVASRQSSLLLLHHSSLVLFILSAMTHIEQGIRRDSVRFLSVLVENTSPELGDAVVRAHWAKILRNLMQLLNWTVENTKKNAASVSFSVTTSNAALGSAKSIKIQKDRRLQQLNLLSKFIQLGCLREKREEKSPGEVEPTAIQIHSLTMSYMVASKANPYANLKLFNALELPGNQNRGSGSENGSSSSSKDAQQSNPLINVDGLSSEDLSSRREILIEMFYSGLVKGLEDVLKDDSVEIRKLSQVILDDLAEIKADYELQAQN